jgi:hypothetical protein
MERYKGIKRHEVPPHVFAITDTAYRSMLQGELLCRQHVRHGIVNAYLSYCLDSSVCIAMGYECDGLGSIPGSAQFFSSPQCPDRIWGPTEPPIQ